MIKFNSIYFDFYFLIGQSHVPWSVPNKNVPNNISQHLGIFFKEFWRQMLKASPLNSSGLHILVLFLCKGVVEGDDGVVMMLSVGRWSWSSKLMWFLRNPCSVCWVMTISFSFRYVWAWGLLRNWKTVAVIIYWAYSIVNLFYRAFTIFKLFILF